MTIKVIIIASKIKAQQAQNQNKPKVYEVLGINA